MLSNLVQTLMAFIVKENTQEMMCLMPQRYYITYNRIINVMDHLRSSQSLWQKTTPDRMISKLSEIVFQ